MSMGMIGILVALLLFLFLTYQGFSTYYVAPICALIVAFTNHLNLLETFTSTYIDGFAHLIVTMFSVVFLGAIFGQVFADTGAAESIAKTLTAKFVETQIGDKKISMALIIMTLISGLCTMGGIDGYVLVFTMFPVSLVMAEACDIPRRFIPGMLVLNCAFMAAPGAPQITNVLAGAALAQNGYMLPSTSGLFAGIVGVIIIAVGGYYTLYTMITKAKRNGEHFNFGSIQRINIDADRPRPHFILALMPLAVVFVCYSVIELHIALSLSIGIIVNLVLMQQFIQRKSNTGMIEAIKDTLNRGSGIYPSALVMICTPAALAAVIQATDAFLSLADGMAALDINIMLFAFLSVAVVVALTSSPPAAIMMSIGIVCGVISNRGLDVNVGAIYRIAAFTSITFESLPWNGQVLMCQGFAGTNHKESYPAYFWQTVVWTTVAALVAVVIAIVFPALP